MSAIIDDNTTDMAMEETLISPRFYTTNYKNWIKLMFHQLEMNGIL